MTPDPIFPANRFCRFDEMTELLHRAAHHHPDLMTVTTIGRSFEGRDIWLATITDTTTGPADEKSAHWTDANIHATEVAGGAAALYLIRHLLEGHARGDATVRKALSERTFYVVPRVNPDGVEAFLADHPRYLRSSIRSWPWVDGRRWPGSEAHDIDGDGRILTMRVPDVNGAWMEHADDGRVMVPVPMSAETDKARYRLLVEGSLSDYDGFTIPAVGDIAGIDLNRNFPADWSISTRGAGDYPTSEPEVAAVVRAAKARPNICSYNALHTFGGVLLRPSSTRPDAALPHVDLWTFGELGAQATRLTGYRVHSVYEDFTWDRTALMSGAGDDWAYEHLGVYGWTTEFWDVVRAATGKASSTTIWEFGPTPEEELAVAAWADTHAPEVGYVRWYGFDHPQLGRVELGGADGFNLWSNPPLGLLEAEIAPHAEVAVMLALAGPRLEIVMASADFLGNEHWRVRAGLANVGWLPTTVTAHAAKESLVLPLTAHVSGAGITVLGADRHRLGQLAGRSGFRLDGGARSDRTPDRALAEWVIVAPEGTVVDIVGWHQRAGVARRSVTLRHTDTDVGADTDVAEAQ